jgi:hypothetical protein
MAREDDSITDDELLTRMAQVAPPDRKVLLNLTLALAEHHRTGETAVLDQAIKAFWARVNEKARIARN